MAKELGIEYLTGVTLYAHLIRDADGFYWSTVATAFVSPLSANWADYCLSMPEAVANMGGYYADLPAIATGDYTYMVYRARTSGAHTYTDQPAIGMGRFSYDSEAGIVTPLTISTEIGEGFGGEESVINEVLRAGAMPIIVASTNDYKRVPPPTDAPPYLLLTQDEVPGNTWPSVAEYAGVPISVKCRIEDGGVPFLPLSSYEYDLYGVTDEGGGTFTKTEPIPKAGGRAIRTTANDLPFFYVDLSPKDRAVTIAVVVFDNNKDTLERRFIAQFLVTATPIANQERL